jgi:histidyl-tRNA synthetase
MKRADKSQAQLALILGEDEMASSEITIKFLRKNAEQQTVSQENLSSWLKTNLN